MSERDKPTPQIAFTTNDAVGVAHLDPFNAATARQVEQELYRRDLTCHVCKSKSFEFMNPVMKIGGAQLFPVCCTLCGLTFFFNANYYRED